MSYFHTSGSAVDPITALGWGLGIACLAIVALIGVLLLAALFRARAPKPEGLVRTVSRSGSGLPWIYIGTGVSTVVLCGMVIWTLLTLKLVAAPHAATGLTIEIRAHQWWWEIRYVGEPPARTFVTANELHIPVGTPVSLRLIGDDVIHSFWIPALAGKTDVIPGQTNNAWIEADKPGVYRGQCSEYCGLQHAHMSAFVIAEPKRQFEAWWQQQLAPSQPPRSAQLVIGAELFRSRCAACHTVRGIGAGGILGPDLTHLMSRNTIAAGTFRNSPESLSRWIANAQALKPGSRMPQMDLTAPQLDAVTAFVQTLR
ncbi:MAG: cytochrome c oxidase subunit II [Pseudomonadota bacterium]